MELGPASYLLRENQLDLSVYHENRTMKKNRRNSLRAKSATRTGVSRRRFLGSVAAGVGASSLLQSRFGIASSVPEVPIPPTPENFRIVTGKQVLTASDFQYAGLFTLPAPTAGVRFGYSSGAMTARRVGGTLQFLMTGVNAEAGGLPGDLVHEVSYPGVGSSIAAAPRAALLFTIGHAHDDAIGQLEGEPLYHARIDPTEY
jgi:hypothetical protein